MRQRIDSYQGWRGSADQHGPVSGVLGCPRSKSNRSPARCFRRGEDHLSDQQHSLAPHHLPGFITAPGETDILMVVMGVFLIVAILAVGNFYLKLHTLPERMAHKSQKLQFEIVAVLGLLALFTHVHMFWIAGLFLAMIDIPDFGTPLRSIAQSVEKIAGGTPDVLIAEKPVEVEDRPAALAVEKPETRVSKAKVHGHA